MICKCGYSFAKDRLEGNWDAFRSYLVVDNRDYKQFMKAEVKAWEKGASKDGRLRAIAKAAQYAGNMLECPEYGQIGVSLPRTNEVWSLTRNPVQSA